MPHVGKGGVISIGLVGRLAVGDGFHKDDMAVLWLVMKLSI